jgi:hypothetical protein
MDIIAVRGIRSDSFRRFLTDWWAVRGVIKKHRGWTFLFITGTDYWGTIAEYAKLISNETTKLVIYMEGNAGVVKQFTIFEEGIVCPISKTRGQHESWLIENRLSLWGISSRNQTILRRVLYEFTDDTAGPIICLDTSKTRLNRLAGALFDSWKLPKVWSVDSIDELANDKDCEPF